MTLPTPEELDELERLLAQATPGPLSVVESKRGDLQIVTGFTSNPLITQVPLLVATIPAQIGGYEPERRADAETLAMARNLAPRLIAAAREVEMLRAELARRLTEANERIVAQQVILHALKSWMPSDGMEALYSIQLLAAGHSDCDNLTAHNQKIIDATLEKAAVICDELFYNTVNAGAEIREQKGKPL